jgi:hypothetical protein
VFPHILPVLVRFLRPDRCRTLIHDLAAVGATLSQINSMEVTVMNSGESWSFEAVQSLVAMAREGVPVSVISLKLKRSITDVRAKLIDLGLNPPADA